MLRTRVEIDLEHLFPYDNGSSEVCCDICNKLHNIKKTGRLIIDGLQEQQYFICRHCSNSLKNEVEIWRGGNKCLKNSLV